MNPTRKGQLLEVVELLRDIRDRLEAGPAEVLHIGATVALVGLSERTVWSKVAAGEMPAPLRLSENRRGWRRRDLLAWLDGLQADHKPIKIRR